MSMPDGFALRVEPLNFSQCLFSTAIVSHSSGKVSILQAHLFQEPKWEECRLNILKHEKSSIARSDFFLCSAFFFPIWLRTTWQWLFLGSLTPPLHTTRTSSRMHLASICHENLVRYFSGATPALERHMASFYTSRREGRNSKNLSHCLLPWLAPKYQLYWSVGSLCSENITFLVPPFQTLFYSIVLLIP